MPRKARIDAPGALHHIMARGIERSDIFKDNQDRNDFIRRLGKIITQTSTDCYAWALLPNHFHLLLRTGKVPIATVMRRLLTGYAIRFNRRHKRNGHLFQNRYKSILCQEDIYLKELVRYIHLNPLRAKIIHNISELDTFPYCGHSVLMGKHTNEWQQIDSVLAIFGKKIPKARRLYSVFVESGIKEGKRSDLVGGGLIRSAGGWSAVNSLRRAGIFFKSDERILGNSDFVETVLADAQEVMDRKYELEARGITIEQLIHAVADLLSIRSVQIYGTTKIPVIVKARSLVCYWGSSELGLAMTDLAKELGVSLPTVSIAVRRGEKIAYENNYSLKKLMNVNI